MRTTRLRLMLAAALAMWTCVVGGCAQSQVGTETGNPPWVSESHLRVVAVGENKVRVSGDAGTVKGSNEVTVRNITREGATVAGAVAEDGSFSVTLKGSVGDAYEVVASNAEGKSTPRILGPSTGGDGRAPNPDASWKQLHLCSDDDPRDPVEVSDVRLEDDTLHLSVSHAGGCATHGYGLCFGSRWGESYPIQLSLTVLHDAQDDGCEAYLTEELSFDLTPFQAAYEEAYLSEEGAASFGIEDCSDANGCGVVYEWAGLPEVPKSWVTHSTDCGFAFEGPSELENVPVQGIDSCVVQYDSEECSVHGDSGWYGDSFDWLAEEPEYARFSINVGSREAQVHLAELQEEGDSEPRYVLGIYAPEEADSMSSVTLFVDCKTPEGRDALLPLARSLTFE